MFALYSDQPNQKLIQNLFLFQIYIDANQQEFLNANIISKKSDFFDDLTFPNESTMIHTYGKQPSKYF